MPETVTNARESEVWEVDCLQLGASKEAMNALITDGLREAHERGESPLEYMRLVRRGARELLAAGRPMPATCEELRRALLAHAYGSSRSAPPPATP